MKIGEKRGAVEKIHGMSSTRFFRIWAGMLSRCGNKNVKIYPRYGGRGIKVCERWLNFMNFKEDMLDTYKRNLSIERLNNNGDYTKENCKWATWSEQMLNRNTRVASKAERIKADLLSGETQKQIAERLGVTQSGISKFLKRKIYG